MSAKILRVNHSYNVTFASSDPTQPLDPSTVVASALPTSVLTITPNGDGSINIKAVTPGGAAAVTFSAPGFSPTSESVNVMPLPSIVVTDGPVS